MIINPYVYSGVSIDADAQAFITAAGITDATQKTAINQLVLDLKTANIWTKMKAIYPLVGGTSTTHKWNLKDPQDTNAAFRLSFNGGLTHSSSGILGNGTNGWIDTFLNTSTQYSSAYDLSLIANIYTDWATTGLTQTHIGNTTGASSQYRIESGSSTTERSAMGTNGNSISKTVTSTTHKGFWGASRTANNVHNFIDPTGTIDSNTTTITATLPNATIGLIGRRGASTTDLYSAFGYSFFAIGLGLSTTELTNFKTSVGNFQSTLGRI